MAGGTKLIADNRRARHDYHLLERFEAGLVGPLEAQRRHGDAAVGKHDLGVDFTAFGDVPQPRQRHRPVALRRRHAATVGGASHPFSSR